MEQCGNSLGEQGTVELRNSVVEQCGGTVWWNSGTIWWNKGTV